VTGPENAGQAESPVASKDSEATADGHVPTDSPHNGASSAPPRQRSASGDSDPSTVKLRLGAPEHARRNPGPGNGQSTVRVGGYTSPERVPPAAAPNASATQSRSVRVPRRTSLQLKHLDPWSVLKLSLVLSIVGFLVWLVAVGVLYGVLAGMGVWDQINGTYSDFTQGNNQLTNTELISGGRVFGVAFVIGLVNVVLMTALATVGSLVYNIAADFVGGVEVTLSEPD
jgi:Transmembrane domain of unknown function (DUF3566)